MSFVVDNSIAIAWCFEQEHTPAVLTILDRLRTEKAVAPQLWPLEAANVLLIAERRGRIAAPERQRLIGFLRALPIDIDDQTASQVWTATAQLAEQHRLSAYDATYLELALRLGLPLATTDRALIAAAGAAGVPLLPTA